MQIIRSLLGGSRIIVPIVLMMSFLSLATPRVSNESLLESRIDALEERLSVLENALSERDIAYFENGATLFRNPDYDSGWIPLEPGEVYTLKHGQGVYPFVYLLGWDSSEQGYAVHQVYQGVDFWLGGDASSCGIMWCCPRVDEICVYRDPDDVIWDEFRVYIWRTDDA